MTGAKVLLLASAALALPGCAGGLKRFAPPGIVKYEDLAKGQPVNPAIAARIDAQADEAGGFPNLSEQPNAAPEGIAGPERTAMEEALLAERDALNLAIGNDQALASAERETSLEERRDRLGEEIRKDDAAARRERGLPARPIRDGAQ